VSSVAKKVPPPRETSNFNQKPTFAKATVGGVDPAGRSSNFLEKDLIAITEL